jgi:hypothetical protein
MALIRTVVMLQIIHKEKQREREEERKREV